MRSRRDGEFRLRTLVAAVLREARSFGAMWRSSKRKTMNREDVRVGCGAELGETAAAGEVACEVASTPESSLLEARFSTVKPVICRGLFLSNSWKSDCVRSPMARFCESRTTTGTRTELTETLIAGPSDVVLEGAFGCAAGGALRWRVRWGLLRCGPSKYKDSGGEDKKANACWSANHLT